MTSQSFRFSLQNTHLNNTQTSFPGFLNESTFNQDNLTLCSGSTMHRQPRHQLDLLIRYQDETDAKIPLTHFSSKAKLALLGGHKWLFETIKTWETQYSPLTYTQSQYESDNSEFFPSDFDDFPTSPQNPSSTPLQIFPNNQLDILIDDTDHNVKRYPLIRLNNYAILKNVSDYRPLRVVLGRTIACFETSLGITETIYKFYLKRISEWCRENYEKFSKTQVRGESEGDRVDCLDSLLHINTDFMMLQNLESLEEGLEFFEGKNGENGENGKKGISSETKGRVGGDGEDVYNYDGGLNSNLLKQNRDLKENLDELNLRVELKDSSIEQMIGEMESLRKEIELKNSNIEENERRITGLGLEVENRNSGVVGLKNQLSCYEGLHHERKKDQLDFVEKIREMQNVEFEGINQGVEDVKYLVSGLAAAFTETNKVVQQKLKDLDEKINQKKKFSESQILKS
jgi:hypothetical protein